MRATTSHSSTVQTACLRGSRNSVPKPNANKSAPSARGLPALVKRRGPRQSRGLASRRPTAERRSDVTLQSLGPTAFRFVWLQDESSRTEMNLLPVESGRNLMMSCSGVNPPKRKIRPRPPQKDIPLARRATRPSSSRHGMLESERSANPAKSGQVKLKSALFTNNRRRRAQNIPDAARICSGRCVPRRRRAKERLLESERPFCLVPALLRRILALGGPHRRGFCGVNRQQWCRQRRPAAFRLLREDHFIARCRDLA